MYLDQNVISDLAKIKLGRLTASPRRDALEDFEQSFRAAVLDRGDARGIESHIHRWESSAVATESEHETGEAARDNVDIDDGETSLFREIRQLLAVLSWGLHCQPWLEVVKWQTVLTVVQRRYGVVYPTLWRAGFTKDPNESNICAGVQVGGNLFLVTADWRPHTPLRPGWAVAVEADRQNGRYSDRATAPAEVITDIRPLILHQHELVSWSDMWPNGSAHPTDEQMTAFINGATFAGCPTMDVWSKVLGHVLSEKLRPLKDSDQQDVNMLAVAIPYCDLVITDAFMANVVHQTKLPEKYGTVVLSTKVEDLRTAIDWLDKGHAA